MKGEKSEKSLKSEKGGALTLHTLRTFTPSHSDPRRRGSVLLIVVVLLLVLAILGMAYLATTRVDRLTSSQDVVNSQIDTLTDGVRDMATSAIVNSLFSLANYDGIYQYQYRGTIPAPT